MTSLTSTIETPLVLPVLPLRDVVVYPHMVIPLFVGRKKSILALQEAIDKGQKQVLLVAQKEAAQEEPGVDNIYTVGTVATILQFLKLPDGTVKVLVEGTERAQVTHYVFETPFFLAACELLPQPDVMESEDIEGLMRTALSQFEKYAKLNKKIPTDIANSLESITDPGRLVDTIAAHMSLKIADKQQILDLFVVRARLERLTVLIESEIELLQVEHRIRSNVKQQMDKTQKDYYLNEQLKAIHKELGDDKAEVDAFKKKIKDAKMPKEAEAKALVELHRLEMMPAMSAEATVCRNYLDCMVNVPWKKQSRVKFDIKAAAAMLDAEHFGLEKVKERILEYLAVQKRVGKDKGPVLCLVGPPGVGKTSLGQSIARATQRKFVRVSLGGVRDEADIRGHRRTYVGAMPGKIIQKLSKVGVRNPLFLLDEIDKMAMDYRGDPASALLEVLDPEQNMAFSDHYLEVDYDLSNVMFLATANTLNIPLPLIDRMEVMHLSGYTEDEKMHIATRYLVPRQRKASGLREAEIEITQEALLDIIRYYTREAGVRGLEREIAKICRKVVKQILTEKSIAKLYTILPSNLEDFLGVRKCRFGLAEDQDRIGQVTGLAWTEVGGEILTIETVVVPGKGKVHRTGKLGDVMQESIEAAVTVVRSRAAALGIPVDFYEKNDIHIHIPEGATPKDGPSAGIGMCTALVSALTKIPAKACVAMTGEITLRGEVLPIGGLKSKLLAARRAGITQVIIPEENRRDLTEIPANITEALDIKCVRWIDEVFAIALSSLPVPSIPAAEISLAAKKESGDATETGSVGRH